MVSLNLSRNNVTGSLPATIRNFSHVTHLWLGYNHIDKIPDSIGELNLQALDLNANKIKILPDSIGNLTQLRYFTIRENQLEALLDSVGNLQELRSLSIHSNPIKELPSSIGMLSNLEGLDASWTLLETLPPEVGGLTNLRVFKLHCCKLTSIPPEIGTLANLRSLNLMSNQLTVESFPVEFSQLLDSLEVLSLHNNPLTSLPEPVSKLKNLKGLDISWMPIESLAGIGQMESLEILKLHGTKQLTDLPEEMSSLTQLKELWLQGSGLTKFPLVVTKLLNLEKLLIIYNPQLNDELPLSLINLTNLEEFAFDGTSLCVPSNSIFQDWLARIPTVKTSGIQCSSTPPTEQLTLKKAGNGTGTVIVGDYICGSQCAELNLPVPNHLLSVFQAIPDSDSDFIQWQDESGNILDGTYQAQSGDVVVAVFEEFLPDENYLSLYTNPTDPQFLKLETKDGDIVEYFGTKDENGQPIDLTHIYINSPNEFVTKVIMDEYARPIRFINDNGTDFRIKWLSDTVIEVTMIIPGEQIESPVIIDLQNPTGNLSPEQVEILIESIENFQDGNDTQALLPSMSPLESIKSANYVDFDTPH